MKLKKLEILAISSLFLLAGALLVFFLSLLDIGTTPPPPQPIQQPQECVIYDDEFEINRRVVFYNGITSEYILNIEGFCSIEADGMDRQLEVTCKTGKGFKKHFLGLSDNVTYFAEQLSAEGVSTQHYKVIFKPLTIVPDIDIKLTE